MEIFKYEQENENGTKNVLRATMKPECTTGGDVVKVIVYSEIYELTKESKEVEFLGKIIFEGKPSRWVLKYYGSDDSKHYYNIDENLAINIYKEIVYRLHLLNPDKFDMPISSESSRVISEQMEILNNKFKKIK